MKSQAWLKEAVISIIGSALIWIGSQMRDDFKVLVMSVNQLTIKIEVLANQVSNQSAIITDHEVRLRKVEKDDPKF